jgi:hypothetical protein
MRAIGAEVQRVASRGDRVAIRASMLMLPFYNDF